MEEAGMRLYEARVIVALPYRNLYVVESSHTKGRVTAVSIEAGGDRRSGIGGGPTYLPGTVVLIAVNPAQTGEGETHQVLPPLIIGPFPQYPKNSDTDFFPKEDLKDLENSINNSKLENLLVKIDKESPLNHDYSYAKALDTHAGEYALRGQLGSAFIISDYIAQLRAGKGCGITFTNIDNMAELVARNWDMDLEVYRHQVLQRSSLPVSKEEWAYAVYEAQGAVNEGTPIYEDSDDPDDPRHLNPLTTNLAGYFRRQLLSGGQVEGALDGITTYQGEAERHIYGEGIYPGVFAEDKRMEGIYRLRASKEIRFEKTPVIVLPREIIDPLTDEEVQASTPEEGNDNTDLQDKVEAFSLESTEELHALTPLMENAFGTYDEEQYYYKGLRQEGGIWVFPTVEEVKEALQLPEEPASLPIIEDSKSEYETTDIEGLLGPEIEVTPGRRIRLFNNSSVFIMTEDGQVVIGDGYGSELRLGRGNASLSAPVDVSILPGRDFRTLAPGNAIIKGGKRAELIASTGSAFVKAEENLHLLGGNGRTGGAVVLEGKAATRATNGVNPDTILRGESIGGGVFIKAPKGQVHIAAATGIYVGAHEKKTSPGSQIGIPVSSINCPIHINAGAGNLSAMGSTTAIMGTAAASISMENTIDGIYCSGSGTIVAARNQLLYAAPAQEFSNSESGTVNKPYLSSSGVQTKKAGLPKTRILQIDSAVKIRGSLEQIGSYSLEGEGFASQGFNTNEKGVGEFQVPIIFSPIGGNGSSIADASMAPAKSAMTSQALQHMSEYSQQATSPAFPGSKEVYHADPTHFKLIAPRWHTLLEEKAVMEEKPVTNDILEEDTYPYPGKAALEKSDALIQVKVENGEQKVIRKSLLKYPANIQS